MYPYGLSIIMPAYNEEATLEETAAQAVAEGRRAAGRCEVLIVDDGSRDGTAAAAARLAKRFPEVRVLRHERNRGSGAAIKTGMAAARFSLVTYAPADGQFALAELPRFVEAAHNADIVLGVRRGRPDYSPVRRFYSSLYVALVNFLFGHRLRDVNWVHLWRREVLDALRLRSDGVFMMEEIVCRALARGARIVEIPSGSRPRVAGEAKSARFSAVFRTFIEMTRVWLEVRL